MGDYPSLTYFNRISGIGSRILKVLGGSPAGAETDHYLALVEEIYQILAQIHDALVDVAIDVSQAETMDEAAQILMRVQQMGLKETMKAQDMCDELQRLGQQLRSLPYDRYGMAESEKVAWDELCRNLERREGGTSTLYDTKLYELRILPHTETALEHLKAVVEEISDLLVIQKARFDHLAKLAKAVRARRS